MGQVEIDTGLQIFQEKVDSLCGGQRAGENPRLYFLRCLLSSSISAGSGHSPGDDIRVIRRDSFHLAFADVLARGWQHAYRPVGRKAFRPIQRDRGSIRLSDVEDNPTTALPSRPCDDRIDQGGSDPLPTHLRRNPHGEQPGCGVALVMVRSPDNSDVAFIGSRDECYELRKLALPILDWQNACLVKRCPECVRRIGERTQPNRAQPAHISSHQSFDPDIHCDHRRNFSRHGSPSRAGRS